MMTRDEVCKDIIKIPNKQILAELPTNFGKSLIALKWLDSTSDLMQKILIVIPRLVLIDNWKQEFMKWGFTHMLPCVKFVTYVSYPKLMLKEPRWEAVIFDEVHHLSERCRAHVNLMQADRIMMLSATVNRDLKWDLRILFKDLFIYKISTKQAIEEKILPDPRVYLIPLTLNNTDINCEIVKNKSQKIEIVVPYKQRFEYNKVRNRRVVIKCTQRQYYNEISSLIDWYKNRFKQLFLIKSGERLKWLSNQKTEFVKSILKYLDSERTLTFCNSINQTEELGKYCINSKNKESDKNLKKFNEKKIKHITACNMLDEGINLTNCRVGVYAVLNSSERMVKQKLGRLLRHPEPVIIIPYYKDTRDEEIVRKMLEDYNSELVKTVSNLNEIKL